MKTFQKNQVSFPLYFQFLLHIAELAQKRRTICDINISFFVYLVCIVMLCDVC